MLCHACPGFAQENPLAGAIDVHVHAAPDSTPRSIDAIDLARLAKSRGMRGLVLKSHHEPTASRAYLVRKKVPGIEVFGGIEALRGIRVEHAWRRKPPLGNRDHPLPRHPTLLAATTQNVPPHAKHPFPEHAEAVQIPGYCVVVEAALHNCTEPFAGDRRSVVHACAELLPNLLQLCSHTLADRQALYAKKSVPVFSADVRKAQKIERLRLIFPSSRSIFFGEPPELNQTRFVWMKFQPELRQSFP